MAYEWLSSVWDTVSDALNSNLGKTALSVGGSVIGNYLTSSSQADQSEAYANYMNQLSQNQANQSQQAQQNYKDWLKLLKPTEEQKESYRAAGAKRIWADWNSANKKLSNNLASRNIGGGQLATGLADNKRAAFSKLGDLESDVEQYGAGTTPSSAAPTTTSAVNYPTLGTTDYFTSNLGNLMQYGSGMSLASMLKNSGNLFSTTSSPSSTGLSSLYSNYGTSGYDFGYYPSDYFTSSLKYQ